MVTNKAQETFSQHHNPGFIVFIVPWRLLGSSLEGGGHFHSIPMPCRLRNTIRFRWKTLTWMKQRFCMITCPCASTIAVQHYMCMYTFFGSAFLCTFAGIFFGYALKFCTSYTHGHIALWLHFIWFDSFFIRKWLKCPNKQIQYPNNEKKVEKTIFISYCHYV